MRVDESSMSRTSHHCSSQQRRTDPPAWTLNLFYHPLHQTHKVLLRTRFGHLWYIMARCIWSGGGGGRVNSSWRLNVSGLCIHNLESSPLILYTCRIYAYMRTDMRRFLEKACWESCPLVMSCLARHNISLLHPSATFCDISKYICTCKAMLRRVSILDQASSDLKGGQHGVCSRRRCWTMMFRWRGKSNV